MWDQDQFRRCASSTDTCLTSLKQEVCRNANNYGLQLVWSCPGLWILNILYLGGVWSVSRVFVNPESIQKESRGIREILSNLEATNWRFMNMDYTNADILMSTEHVSQQPGWDWTQNLLVMRKLPRWMWLTTCVACRTYRFTDHWLTGCHRTLDLPVRTHASGAVTGPPILTVTVRAALPRARFWNTGRINKQGKHVSTDRSGSLALSDFQGGGGKK